MVQKLSDLLSWCHTDPQWSQSLQHKGAAPLIMYQLEKSKSLSLSHLGNSSVTQDVIWTCGLLDPKRIELSQAGHPSDGLSYIPPLVSINHLTCKKTPFNICADLNREPGALAAIPERYLVRSSLVRGGTGVCRLLSQRQLSPWIWSIRFQAHLCRAVGAWLHLMPVQIPAEVFSLRNLRQQLVRVSQPCTGGRIGRITLSQHLILWEKEKRVQQN